MQRFNPNYPPPRRQCQGQYHPHFQQHEPNHHNQQHGWHQHTPPHHGQAFHEDAYAPQYNQMQRQLEIEDAIQIGREQVPGRVVKVELETKGGRLIYEVDVVNQQGIKYEVKIDANSGAILEVELD